MRIIISGASGLIGLALVKRLTEQGHAVARLVRGVVGAGSGDIRWDPVAAELDPGALEGADALVHLSGENVASGRWTATKKRAIHDSRVVSTRLIAKTVSAMKAPPRVWLCASATGYFGSRGDEELTEDSPPGTGFLAQVCMDWEEATKAAAEAGIRVVNLLFGVVLSGKGGALGAMLMPIKLGLGGVIGDGRQWVSWITLEDAVSAIEHILRTDALAGPVNMVSPGPVTNRELTKTLGRLVRRPTVLPLPAFAARFVLGEMANKLLLASARVHPARLLESGFRFRYAEIESALQSLVT